MSCGGRSLQVGRFLAHKQSLAGNEGNCSPEHGTAGRLLHLGFACFSRPTESLGEKWIFVEEGGVGAWVGRGSRGPCPFGPASIAFHPSAQYPFESLFRSQHYALLDNSCREYLFLCDFFLVAGTPALDLFNAVMGKTLAMFLVSICSRVRWGEGG